MKFNLFVALAALAFGSSLVLAAPIDLDTQDLAVREPTYDVEDFIARDFADADDFYAREYFDDELVEREYEQEDIFARDRLDRSAIGNKRKPKHHHNHK